MKTCVRRTLWTSSENRFTDFKWDLAVSWFHVYSTVLVIRVRVVGSQRQSEAVVEQHSRVRDAGVVPIQRPFPPSCQCVNLTLPTSPVVSGVVVPLHPLCVPQESLVCTRVRIRSPFPSLSLRRHLSSTHSRTHTLCFSPAPRTS